MLFGPQRSLAVPNIATAGAALCTDGANVWLSYVSGTSVKVAKSANQGTDWNLASAVTVDTNAATGSIILNESFVRDPVTGTLHVFWDRNEDSGSNPCALVTSHSTDGGATWSTPVVVDSGASYGNNRFYRIGVAAYNGVVGVAYASIDRSVFTTAGLLFSQSTDGGATYSAPAALYTVGLAGEPNAHIGEDGSMHVSWYDPGTNTNAGGDLYYARGTWSAIGWTWPGSKTRVTTGQVCGRSRVATSNGVVMLITNTNWGGSAADVATVRSTDNGATWGAVVTQATHTTNALDHPWLNLDAERGVMIWTDFATSPISYGSKASTDGGATWTSNGAPLTTTGSSDAPKIVTTNDCALIFGCDNVGGGAIYSILPFFAPDPAATATTVLDNFNRANEDPLSGGGTWSQEITASGAAKLVSNAATRRSASGSFDRAGSYRNDQSITSGEVFCTIGGTLSDCEFDLILNKESPNNGYAVIPQNGPAQSTLVRNDAGSWTTLSSESGIGLTAGDKWLLRITPTSVAAFRYVSALSDWQEVARSQDTTYRTLKPGFNLVGNVGVPTIDDFGVSTLAAPSNTVAPAATGAVGVGQTLSTGRGTWATANGATPTRYFYQWQSSPAGANTWSNISRAALPFYTVTDASKDYRCVITAKNSIGSSTANSNLLTARTGSASPTLGTLGASATGTVLDRGIEAGSIGTLRTAAAGQLALHAAAAPTLPPLTTTAAGTLLDRGTEAGVIGPLRLTATATRSGPKEVQSAYNTSTGTNQLTLTLPNPVTAGNLIAVTLLMFGSGSPPFPSSTVDTLGNSYATIGDEPNSGFTRRVEILYAKNSAAGACIITITMSAVGNFAGYATEVSGLSTTAPLDKQAFATGTSAAADSGLTATTTGSDAYLIGAIWTSSARTATPDAAFTPLKTPPLTVAGTDQFLSGSRVVAATGAYHYSASLDLSSDWVGAIATFKVVGAGAASQLAFQQQIGGACLSGQAFQIQPIVQIQDSNGQLVTTATNAVTATITAGNGTLVGTVTVNAVGGVATFTNLGITEASSADNTFTVTFSANGLTSVSNSKAVFICTATALPAELPRVFLNTTMPTRTGALIRVGAGGDLQSAMNSAVPGDWIVLDHTATYVGDFVFPAKTGADAAPGGNAVIVIISDAIVDFGFLPANKRVSPTDAANMPKIRTVSGNGRAFSVTDGVPNMGGWRLVGLDVAPDPANLADMTRIIRFGDEITLTPLGANTPFNFVVDRCYVHGNAGQNIQHGVSLQSASSAVIDSYISTILHTGADAQAVGAWNSPGPVKIVNNYCEATGENILIGNSDGIFGQGISDVEVRYNYCRKLPSWNPNDPSFAGTTYAVKNLLEIKFVTRALIEGNLLDGCWVGGQTGYAFLIKSNNYENIPTTDVTIRYNWVKNTAGFFDFNGQVADGLPAGTFPPWMARLNVHDNLGTNIGAALYDPTSQVGYMAQNLEHICDLTFEHNTALAPRYFYGLDDPSQPYNVRLTVRNNLGSRGAFGVKCGGQAEGSASLAAVTYGGAYTFVGNVLATSNGGASGSSGYPAGNQFPASVAALGLVDATLVTSGALSGSSVYKGTATDGTDPGVDWATLSSVTQFTLSGDRTSAGTISGTLARSLVIASAVTGALLNRGTLARPLLTLSATASGTLAPAGSVNGSGAPRLLTLTAASVGRLLIRGTLAGAIGILRAAGTGASAAFGVGSSGRTYVAIDDTRRYVVRTGTMSLLKVVIHAGDLTPPITGTLLLADRTTPQNLTGATVTLEVTSAVSGAVVFTGRPVTLVDALNGKVRYDWQAGDTATAGRYEGRFHVVYADATPGTFPNGHDGFPIHVDR